MAGCTITPLKGGKAMTSKSTQGIEQSGAQGDNPAAALRQDQEANRSKSYTVLDGSRIVETRIVTEAGAPVTNSQVLLVDAPMTETENGQLRAANAAGLS